MSAVTRRVMLGGAGAVLASALLPRAAWAGRGRRGSLRLAFFTDVHTRLEWETPLALERAAQAVNARRPDLVVGGGDLITDGFQSGAEAVAPRWDAYLEHFQRALSSPVHCAIGNHDLVAAIPEDGSPRAADPRSAFRSRLGVDRTFRSLDAGGYHLVLLDPVEVVGGDLKYRGWVGEEQLRWLEQDLAGLDATTPVVLVTHMPLLTAFYQATEGTEYPAPANRAVVNNLEVLERFAGRNLLLVLQGHLHVDEMLRWRDTTFITGGAVCGRWWRGEWHGTREGFGVVTLRRDRVEWEYVTYGWHARRP